MNATRSHKTDEYASAERFGLIHRWTRATGRCASAARHLSDGDLRREIADFEPTIPDDCIQCGRGQRHFTPRGRDVVCKCGFKVFDFRAWRREYANW